MRDPKAIVAFARRDWGVLERLSDEHWRELRARHGAAQAVRLADDLRRQIVAGHPGWPDETERREDLEHHVRVSEALRRVAARRG